MIGLSVDAARAAMLASVSAPRAERVALEAAAGRVLAEPVIAIRDQPPFDASAMDGWAVRSGDGAARLRIVGESAAGRGFAGTVGSGEAVRIFTGAPVPQGADAVVIQEAAERDGDHVSVSAAPPGQHVRPRGGDFREGQVLLPAGLKLTPWRLSLAASAGRAQLSVAARPKVAVLSTGEEIVPAGTDPQPHQIFNSGGPALAALIGGWGGEATQLSLVSDDAEAIVKALSPHPITPAKAGVQDFPARTVISGQTWVPAFAGTDGNNEFDLIVTIGGASVGDYDLVKPALARLGLDIRVGSVNLRPGKPTWFGVLADGRKVLGLPGNPASALVAAELFLRPLLAAMQGADPSLAMLRARLAEPLPANGPREHWMRAKLASDENGLIAEAFSDQDSSLVTVMAEADALLKRLPDAPAAEAGSMVEVLIAGR